MPHIPILTVEAAPPEVAELYYDFQHKMAFPGAPNFIKVQGHSLSVARGTWGLVQNILVKGALPRSLKEMMFVAISRDRACRYCEAAHTACCRMLGVDPRTIEDLVSRVEEITPAKTREIIKFAIRCSRDPQSLDAEAFATLERHGLMPAEIVEIIGMSALAVYANIVADATGVEPDAMFSGL